MRPLTMAIFAAAALLAACTSSSNKPATDAANGAAGASATAGQPAPGTTEYFNVVVGDRVFFGTDQYDLSPEAQLTLRKQAEWFAQNPGATAVIEGHTDERGTREYNLALGARRANSVEAFLVSQGVDASRLRTVSYGKERPVALGSNEQAWAQNRRAVTVVTKAPTS